jgi:hypothetical protein
MKRYPDGQACHRQHDQYDGREQADLPPASCALRPARLLAQLAGPDQLRSPPFLRDHGSESRGPPGLTQEPAR